MFLILFLIGNIFLLFLILTLMRYEKIIVNFCERKNISNFSILNSKWYITYLWLTLILVPPFIICLFWRLFVVIFNGSIYVISYINDLQGLEYRSLNIYVIILILFISTLFCWINIKNKQHKTGKYNKINIFFGLFLLLFLLLSIITCISQWGINYFYLLDIFTQSTVIMEIFSMLLDEELILFNNLEKIILPLLNIEKFSIEFQEIKDSLKPILLKSFKKEKNIYIRNSYLGYKRFFINQRNGNIVRKGIQFIIDLVFIMRNKIYESEYLIRLSNIYKNNIFYKGSKILMVTPPAIINFNMAKGSQVNINVYDSNSKLINRESINVNNEIEREMKVTSQRSSYKGVSNYNQDMIEIEELAKFTLNKLKNGNYSKEIEENIILKDNNYINKVNFFLNWSYYEIKMVSKKDITDCIWTYLSYNEKYKKDLIPRFIIYDFINKFQAEELTRLVSNLLHVPLLLDLEYNKEDLKNNWDSIYVDINYCSYSEKDKKFIQSKIKVPRIIHDKIFLFLRNSIEYNFLLDSNLEIKSISVLFNENSNNYGNDYLLFEKIYKIFFNEFKTYIFNYLDRIKENNNNIQGIDEIIELEKEYWNKSFLFCNSMYHNRYNILKKLWLEKFLDRLLKSTIYNRYLLQFDPLSQNSLGVIKQNLQLSKIKAHWPIRSSTLNLGLKNSISNLEELTKNNFFNRK